MERKLYCIVNRIKADKLRRRRFAAIMLVLSMIVTSSVFWQLHSTGNAMTSEIFCGIAEHRHTNDCIAKELTCKDTSESHEHTSNCYRYVFGCGKTEHTHTVQCMSDISADKETEKDWEKTLPALTEKVSENMAAIAQSQLGYTESSKNYTVNGSTKRGYTRYGDWYGNPYGDWNATFAYFCMYYAGVSTKDIPYGSGIIAWTSKLRTAKRLIYPEFGEAAVGDIVLLDVNGDDSTDRAGIVVDADYTSDGLKVTLVEGDLDDKVGKREIKWDDEAIVGYVSTQGLITDVFVDKIDLPTLQLGAQAGLYANGTNRVYCNGVQNSGSESAPFVVKAGSTFTVQVTLQRLYGHDTSDAYYTHSDNAPNDAPSWSFFTDANGTRFYTPANIWAGNQSTWGNGRGTTGQVVDGQPLVFKKEYTAPNLTSEQTYSFTYNSCSADDYSSFETFYVKVVPAGASTSQIYILSPTSESNEYRSADTPYEVESDTDIVLEVRLKQVYSSGQSGYIILSDDEYNQGRQQGDVTRPYGGSWWQYFECDGRKIFCAANSWTQNGNVSSSGRKFSFDNATNELVMTETLTPSLPDGVTTQTFTYTFNGAGSGQTETMYIKVNPSTTAPVIPDPTTSILQVTAPEFIKINRFQYEKKPYYLQPGETVTLTATVGPDKYTRYNSAEEYSQAKANNQEPELRFAQIGNTYISTYARYWANDKDSDPGVGKLCTGTYASYSLDGDNLKVSITYTANEIAIGENNKYVASFIDSKDDYNEIEHFWIQVDAPVISVYTAVGWRDKDRIHEAMEGVGGDAGGGKYWSNDGVQENDYDQDKKPGGFGEGLSYIVHKGDWIYLSGIGDGTFGPIQHISGANDIPANTYPAQETPSDDHSGKQNVWKYQMPETVTGKGYYKVDYTLNGVVTPFYFMLSPSGQWNERNYDHADLEIADGGTYKMVAQHYVRPDGTEIETIRIYSSYINDIQLSKVYNSGGTLVGTYSWGDYSKQGELGETQFEYTSKYLTDGKQGRLSFKTVDGNDVLLYNDDGTYKDTGSFWDYRSHKTNAENYANPATGVIEVDKKWPRENTERATFKVDVILFPASEETIIRRPDGTEEHIVTAAADFDRNDTTKQILIKNVEIDLSRQSVIDAVNKCPNHSGLDFTVIDTQITEELRSGNAMIEAFKDFKDDEGNSLNDTLLGGEFDFELYGYEPADSNGTIPVVNGLEQKFYVDRTAANVVGGNIYFDRQFYVDLDMDNGEPKDFYYQIVEKTPCEFENVGQYANDPNTTYYYRTKINSGAGVIYQYVKEAPESVSESAREKYVKNGSGGYDKYIMKPTYDNVGPKANDPGVTYYYKIIVNKNGKDCYEYTTVDPMTVSASDRAKYVVNKSFSSSDVSTGSNNTSAVYDKYVQRVNNMPDVIFSEYTERVRVRITPTDRKTYENVGPNANAKDAHYFYKLTDEYCREVGYRFTDVKPEGDDYRYVKNSTGTYDKYIQKIFPSYDTEVTYLDMTDNVYTYTPKDENGLVQLDEDGKPIAERRVPTFTNIMRNAYKLPSTGGMGTTLFIIGGPMLMFSSAILLLMRKRRKHANVSE